MNETGLAIGSMALLGLVVYWLTNLASRLQNKDWPAAINQVKAFAIGAAGIFLASASDQLGGLQFNGTAFNDLGSIDKLLAALVLASVASTVYDYKAAHDNSDSAAIPNPFRKNDPLRGETVVTVAGVAPSSAPGPTPRA